MLRNYILTALRNFRKNKLYTVLNILGLSFGITCCVTQYSILKHEYSFDDFHEKKDRIYRVVEHHATESGMKYSAVLANPLARALDDNKSKIEDVIAMAGPVHAKMKVTDGEKVTILTEPRVLFTESSFLHHLNFPLVSGGPANLLDEKGTIFITERMAEKYFGEQDPLGKSIKMDNLNLEVKGILKNPPTNTNVPFDFLVSDEQLKDAFGGFADSWDTQWATSAYVVTNATDDLKELEAEINNIHAQHIPKEEKELKQLYLQPLSEAHTDDRYSAVNYVPPSQMMLGMVLIVVLILLVSILNFINLATSQSIRRSREVGIRKTLGGQKHQLVLQFLFETLVQVLAAALIGLTLGQILMDLLNSTVSGMSFRVSYDGTIALFAAVLILVITVLGGAYPALVLTRFNPIQTLRQQVSLSKSSGSFSLRKVLITTQFVIANLLIIATVISTDQMRFIRGKDLGFDPTNVMIIGFSDQSPERMQAIKSTYEGLNFVDKATWSYTPPQTGSSWNTSYNIAGQEPNDNLQANMKFIDADYLDVYNIPLIYGRNIENSYSTDTTGSLLVSRELVNQLGITFDEALNTAIEFNGSLRGKIVGITEDFHVSKLNRSIKPIVMMHVPEKMQQVHLKMANDDPHLAELETIYRQFDQENLFNPAMLTERIEKSYTFENIIYNVVLLFALIAITISLMGLYGLVSFMIAKNRKPISIRKIFGASAKNILMKLSREYLMLIMIAFLVSTPASIWVMGKWLNTFYYRIEISPVHFLLSLVALVSVAMLTVGYKSYKTAISNPVDALRYE